MRRVRLLTTALARDQDLIVARQRARQVAGLVGLDRQDQARIATAVSEVARNALVYAGGGAMHVDVEDDGPGRLLIEIVDRGAGLPDPARSAAGGASAATGHGLGLVGARRLMDDLRIRTGPDGTSVTLVKGMPAATPLGEARLNAIVAELARRAPQDVYAELDIQNQELARSLAELRERHDELERLNHEFEDTNRGVVALYAELDEKAEALRRADEAKSRFLSSASHELRTPLSAIRSLSRLLLDRVDGPLTDEQTHQVALIRKAADGLAELVDDLLDLSKIEAGKIEVRLADFDVETMWSALRGMMKPLLASSPVTLVFEPPPALTLHGDEGKVAQILRNLVSNALKFTEQGEVRLSARQEGHGVAFVVADTGIGIAPQHLDLVFEEFSQIEHPLQRRYKGTGLGLPLCRRLAGLLGGTVTVQSRLGEGSRFTLWIPARVAGATVPDDAGAPSDAAAPAVAREALPPLRTVLIVDDDDAMRYTLARRLRSSFEVHEAADGAEGLAALERITPDAVVLDLQMPTLSGWDFIERVDPTRLRIVVLTAQRLDATQRERLAFLGIDALRKSEHVADELLERLRPPGTPR